MPDWDELLKREKYKWKDPHPSVVSLVGKLWARGFSRVLDLGCGAGRHTVHLSREGFSATGIDPALTGLLHSSAWLQAEGLPIRLCRGDMAGLPFREDSFDCVLAVYVLHHATKGRIRKTVSEIERVLVPGGLLLAMVLTKGDFKYGDGRMIEKDTYLTGRGDEAGVPHHFFDREEVIQVLGSFSILSLGTEKIDRGFPDGSTVHHEHWEVLAKKGDPG